LEGKPEKGTIGLTEALKKASERSTQGMSFLFAANNFKDTDPEVAESLYKEGIEKFPKNVSLIANYAIFLADVRKDYDKAEEYFKKALEIESINGNNFDNYANFLAYVRKDYDKAEEYYKKALEIGQENVRYLDNYANFLFHFRKDYDKAEEYYKKGLDIEPEHLINTGNYAGFLLAKGDEKGFDLLWKVIGLLESSSPYNVLLLECQFYRYAHIKDPESRADAINRIRELLQDGVRSPGWDLSENVTRAIEDGHPHPEFLTQLSKVITDEIDIKELGKFNEW